MKEHWMSIPSYTNKGEWGIERISLSKGNLTTICPPDPLESNDLDFIEFLLKETLIDQESKHSILERRLILVSKTLYEI